MSMKREARFEHELIQDFKDGECIFEEGDTGRELYIVQQGFIKIRKKISGGEIDLAEFKKGDFFGDISLLQSIPRYASAYAKGDTRLLILKPGGFLMKIRRDPTFAFEMLQQLSLRVLVSNDRLFSIVQQYKLPPSEVQKLLELFGGKM
jgi:CRP/FNR family transcriptional regulator, cyclic AMP receptor protein